MASKYQFETIDSIGLHTPNYHRLQRGISRLQDKPISDTKAYNGYLQDNVYDIAIHHSNENQYIKNQIPDLQVTTKKSHLIPNRNSGYYSTQTPLKEYTSQFYETSPYPQTTYQNSNYESLSSPSNYPTQGYSSSRQFSIQPYASQQMIQPSTQSTYQQIVVPAEAAPLSQTYHRAGDSQAACTQFIQSQVPQIGQIPGAIGVQTEELLIDVFSEMPKDQCHYCISSAGVKKFNAEELYYRNWIKEREKLEKERTKLRKELEQNNSQFKQEWEREIENFVKTKAKDKIVETILEEKEKEFLDNVSQESDITRRPQEYILQPQEGDLDSHAISDQFQKEKKASFGKLKSAMNVGIFGKKLLNAVKQTKQDNFLKEQEEEEERRQRERFRQFEDFKDFDFDNEDMPDEEKKRILLLYNDMARQNQEMQQDQRNSQNYSSLLNQFNSKLLSFQTFNLLTNQFFEDELKQIEIDTIYNGLDRIKERIEQTMDVSQKGQSNVRQAITFNVPQVISINTPQTVQINTKSNKQQGNIPKEMSFLKVPSNESKFPAQILQKIGTAAIPKSKLKTVSYN